MHKISMPREEMTYCVNIGCLLSVFEAEVLEDSKLVDANGVLVDSLLFYSAFDGVNVLEFFLFLERLPGSRVLRNQFQRSRQWGNMKARRALRWPLTMPYG